MMQKIRMLLAKEQPVRFISHLDYAKTIERALRRAKLPVALSQGFNPHYKISYGPALGVGETSNGEVVEIELYERVSTEEFRERLEAQLPMGFHLVDLKEVSLHGQSATGLPCQILYKVNVPLLFPVSFDALNEAVQKFSTSLELPWEVERKKGKKKVDMRDFLRLFTLESLNNGVAEFSVALYMSRQGGIKLREVMAAFMEFSGIGLNFDEMQIHRVDQQVETAEGLRSPMKI